MGQLSVCLSAWLASLCRLQAGFLLKAAATTTSSYSPAACALNLLFPPARRLGCLPDSLTHSLHSLPLLSFAHSYCWSCPTVPRTLCLLCFLRAGLSLSQFLQSTTLGYDELTTKFNKRVVSTIHLPKPGKGGRQ